MGTGFGIFTTTSGFGITQPSAHWREGGASARLPAGAPASAQAASVSIWREVREGSLEKRPKAGSANQGGISLSAVRRLIAPLQERTCSYVTSGMGPIWPTRWHD